MPAADATKIPDEPKELDEPVRYLSQKLGLTITLKMPRRIIVDGRDVRVPGKRAKFEHGEFHTRKSDIVDLMDGMLVGHNAKRWNRIFQRAPSQKDMNIMAEVGKRAEAAKRAALEAITKEQPKAVAKYKSFSEFNKRRLAKADPAERAIMSALGGKK